MATTQLGKFLRKIRIDHDERMPSNVHAKSDVDSQTMYIKESVYNGAAENVGRDRMTIAHEIFHLLVHQLKY